MGPRARYDRCMPNIGPLELAIVLIIALVIFGPKRLPDLGRSLGHGMREFKDSITGKDDDDDDADRPEIDRTAADSGSDRTARDSSSERTTASDSGSGERVEGEVVHPRS